MVGGLIVFEKTGGGVSGRPPYPEMSIARYYPKGTPLFLLELPVKRSAILYYPEMSGGVRTGRRGEGVSRRPPLFWTRCP